MSPKALQAGRLQHIEAAELPTGSPRVGQQFCSALSPQPPPPHLQTSLCKTASIMPCLLRKQLVKPAESQNCLAWKGT